MKTYYVYQYKDPTSNLPFYIGKGTKNRMFVHLKETLENTENKRKWLYIQKLLNNGLSPIIEKIADNLAEIAAYELEESLIAYYGRIGIDPGGILTNICEGSRPPVTRGQKHYNYGKPVPVPNEQKRRENISKAKKGRPNGQKGLKKSQAMRDKLSKSQKGKKRTDEQKAKLSEANKGSKNPNYGTFWVTNGVQNKKIRNIEDMPDGWYNGRTVSHIIGFRGSKSVR
jgi:hypothetical protein